MGRYKGQDICLSEYGDYHMVVVFFVRRADVKIFMIGRQYASIRTITVTIHGLTVS